MSNRTEVVKFRISKALKTWLDLAGKPFNSRSELLRLILSRALNVEAKDGKKLDSFFNLEMAPGNSVVVGTRLPILTASRLKECADRRDKTVAGWCSVILLAWQVDFYQLYKSKDVNDNTWVVEWAESYRARAAQASQK